MQEGRITSLSSLDQIVSKCWRKKDYGDGFLHWTIILQIIEVSRRRLQYLMLFCRIDSIQIKTNMVPSIIQIKRLRIVTILLIFHHQYEQYTRVQYEQYKGNQKRPLRHKQFLEAGENPFVGAGVVPTPASRSYKCCLQGRVTRPALKTHFHGRGMP